MRRLPHDNGVHDYRSTLRMMVSAICIFTVSLTIIIFTALSLAD